MIGQIIIVKPGSSYFEMNSVFYGKSITFER